MEVGVWSWSWRVELIAFLSEILTQRHRDSETQRISRCLRQNSTGHPLRGNSAPYIQAHTAPDWMREGCLGRCHEWGTFSYLPLNEDLLCSIGNFNSYLSRMISTNNLFCSRSPCGDKRTHDIAFGMLTSFTIILGLPPIISTLLRGNPINRNLSSCSSWNEGFF